MSAKTSKKSRRKPDEESDFKTPDPMRTKEADEVVKAPTTPEEGRKTRSRANTPQNGKDYKNGTEDKSEPDIIITADTQANKANETNELKVPEAETNEIKVPEAETIELKVPEQEVVVQEVVQEEVVVQEVVIEDTIVETNGEIEAELVVTPEEIEMEPLVVEDNEEVDPELQFDENSDGEHSQKGSPVLSRCKTRRSQTRNIPTPKTPKSVLDQNGDSLADVESTNQDAESEVSQQTEDTEKLEPEIDLNETRESFESAISTKVNVGSDLTREIDFSYSDSVSERNYTNFRKVSSRRSIRPIEELRKKVMRAQGEKQEMQFNESRSSVERLSGTKRKRSEEPDGVKRYKPDPQLGFIAYSINRIKSKFSPRAVEASTPKLTSYRKQDILEDAEISKIENETNPPAPEKKWCSIM